MTPIKKYNMKEQDKKHLFSFNEVREIVKYYEKIAKQNLFEEVEKEFCDIEFSRNDNNPENSRDGYAIEYERWQQLKKKVLK